MSGTERMKTLRQEKLKVVAAPADAPSTDVMCSTIRPAS